MGAETLTGRIVNAVDLIDGILDAGSIRDYTSREQLTSMASHLRHRTRRRRARPHEPDGG